MEKKKVSLSTFLIIVGIIVIGVLACYLVVLTQKEANAKAQVAGLEKSVQEMQQQLQTMQTEKNNLQEKVNAVTNVVGGNNQISEKNTTSENNGIKIEKDEFSLTLPKSWEGKYEIKISTYQSENGEGKNYSFVSTANTKLGASGELFYINICPAEDLGYVPELMSVKVAGDKCISVATPSDVPAADDEKAMEEYATMMKNVKSIVNTIVVK